MSVICNYLKQKFHKTILSSILATYSLPALVHMVSVLRKTGGSSPVLPGYLAISGLAALAWPPSLLARSYAKAFATSSLLLICGCFQVETETT